MPFYFYFQHFHYLDSTFGSVSEYGGRPSWLFGSDITAADVTLVITLFRLSNLGLSQLWEGKLPKLERYFIYARENFPGFKTVTENGF